MMWRFLHIIQKLLSFIFGIICSIFRCKKSKKKVKEDELMEVPTEIVISSTNNEFPNQINHHDVNNQPSPYNQDNYQQDTVLQDWNSWENETNQNNTNQITDVAQTEEQENVNFFENMEPTVKVKKVYVKKVKKAKQNIGNMLNIKPEHISLTAELSTWRENESPDEESGGWDEEEIDINCDQIAAEAKAQRMQERRMRTEENKRLKHMKKQKENHKLGMKVPT